MKRTDQALTSANHPIRQSCRIFRGQIDSALKDLSGRSPAIDAHGARKQLKRARATLRLLRPAIGDDVYRRENIVVRDAARPLSRVRDAQVAVAALEELLSGFGREAASLHLETLREALMEDRDRFAGIGPDARQVNNIRLALRRARTRSTRWEIAEDRWRVLARGLRATYRNGRRTFRTARRSPTTEHLHEWRKQSKYVWHQLEVLAPIAPRAIGKLAGEFHHLSRYLGNEHDLALLRGTAFDRAHKLSRASRKALYALIDERRTELQARAFTLGERLYEDKPSIFEQRSTGHWPRWARRSMTRTPSNKTVRAG